MRSLRDFSFHDLATAPMGLVALVALGAAVAGAFVFGGQGGFARTYEASAVFDDAAGLRAGAPVEVAGVEVGRVTSVSGDFTLGQVVVGLAIDQGVDVGADTRAEIRSSTLFGGHAVRLSGSVQAPLLADLPAADRRIPLARTSVAGGIVDAIDATTGSLDRLDTELVTDVTAQVAGVLAGTRDSAPAALEQLDRVGDVLESRSDELAQLAADGRVVTAAVADREAEIDQLVEAGTRLLDELTTRRDDLATLLGDGHRTVARLTAFLRDHRDAMERLSADVHTVVDRVAPATPEINQALALLGPTFEQLAAARGDGPWVEFVAPSFGPISAGGDGLLDPLLPPVSGGRQP